MLKKNVPSKSKAAVDRPPPVPAVVFRKSMHGYEVLADKEGKFEKIGTLAERTAEVALRPSLEIAPATRAAIEAKRSILQEILNRRSENEIHELLGMMSRVEQSLHVGSDSLTQQNLSDLQYATRSLQGKLKKRLASLVEVTS